MILNVARSFVGADLGKQMEGTLGSLTLPMDIVLRPHFGSQYYSWTPAFASATIYQLALALCGAGTAAINFFLLGWSYKWPLYSTLAWSILLWVGFGYTVARVANLVIHPETESDSLTDGPGLAVFTRFVHGESWAWVRMVYEPASVSIAFTILALTGLIPYLFLPCAYASAYALFMRAAMTYWEGWRFCRRMLDSLYHAPIIQAIAEGAEPPEKLGRTVFSCIPASTPANQKKAIAMQMVGLTPDMEALIAK